METEMSIQSNLILSNYLKPPDNYSALEPKNDIFIENKNITLTHPQDLNNYNNKIYPVNSDSLLQEQKLNYFYKKLGNTYSFLGDKYGVPKIIIGPHWYLYASVTLFFSIFFLLEMIFLGQFLSNILKIVCFIIYFSFLFSYSYTAFINPGYKKYDINSITGEERNYFAFCIKCKIYVNKQKKTSHCRDCDICVEKYDHHCPWTGKCIGDKNLISFYLFLLSISGLFGNFVLVMLYFHLQSLFLFN